MGDAHRNCVRVNCGYNYGNHCQVSVRFVVPVLGPCVRGSLSAALLRGLSGADEHVWLAGRLLGGHPVALVGRRAALQPARPHQVPHVRRGDDDAALSLPHHEHAAQLCAQHRHLVPHQLHIREGPTEQEVRPVPLRHQSTDGRRGAQGQRHQRRASQVEQRRQAQVLGRGDRTPGR